MSRWNTRTRERQYLFLCLPQTPRIQVSVGLHEGLIDTENDDVVIVNYEAYSHTSN